MKLNWKGPILLLIFFSISQATYGMRRLIVKYNDAQEQSSQGRVIASSVTSSGSKSLGHIQIHELDSLSTDEEVESAIEEMRQNPFIAYVEEDVILKKYTNDTHYRNQWGLHDSLSGANVVAAWNNGEVNSTGDASEYVAVVDTGVLKDHPDLDGKVVGGYDFISESSFSNDGNGRDGDATDSGDWIDSSAPCYQGIGSDSSWHGTHVAGIIAAKTNNGGVGVAGINRKAQIVPIRVLGRCGGYSSDIADGIRWAAGGSVPGVPNNPHPAKVINLSLGGEGECSRYMQDAINFAFSRGATVVVAAGNSGVDMSRFTPANCGNVIRVGAVNQSGNKPIYSNYGNGIDVMAPGGGDSNGSGIISTHNTGASSVSSHNYSYQSGTSMAAPHVSGVISLMYAVNDDDLFPGQMLQIIKNSARAFPQYTNCLSNPGLCGAGIIDAYAAVDEALTTTPNPNVPGNAAISAWGSGNELLQISQDGGGCGVVDLTDGGSGGKGGPLSLALGFMLTLLAIRLARRRKTSN